MLAIVEIAGMQFEVQPKEIVRVPLLEGEPGDSVEFSNIILGQDDTETKIGNPYLKGLVTAKIIEHGKEPKVIVFHKKRRKGYKRLRGHRQNYTRIEITDIKFTDVN
ncbi:MAG: 50S ribosomal protein L21 [FCB group bacterium]|jgi:large subunit ribosomal protein L21